MRLLEATVEQQRARDALTFEAWGQGLTAPWFLERELRLRAHPWAAAALTTYLWCDEAGRVLASCEAFDGPASVGAREGVAPTIASVFVEPSRRGHGYASQLLTAVVERRRARGDLAVVLFSEVGTALYQRLGFWPVPAFDTFFDARPGVAPAGLAWLSTPLPAPRRLGGDAATLRLHLSSERLDWHLERERVYAAALGRPALRAHGARVGEATITWTAYWKTNELQVLSLDDGTPAQHAALLGAAAQVAHEVGLPVVRAWETMALDHLPGARRAVRTDELAMFLPLVSGVQAWTRVERGLWA